MLGSTLSVTELKSRRQPAFIDRRRALDIYFLLSDAAGCAGLDLVSGVNANGVTFIGVFSENGKRLQMTTTERSELVITIDGMPVSEFDRFSNPGRVVTTFMEEFSSDLIAYSRLDRVARQSTMTEIVAEYTIGGHQN